ncbi:MAG TPA: thioesterase family protein [Thermoplasmataceae archaeon]|nr:thioesterase family protein [Thermoplasmataceae archaeon]
MMSESVSRISLQIRFKDLDSVGHVNNAIHLTYFEMGRVDYITRFFGNFDPSNAGFVIVHSEVDYKKPIYLNSRVEIVTKITGVGTTSFTFSHMLEDLDAPRFPFAEGNTVGVLLDGSGKKMKVPEEFRKLIS